MSRKNRHLVIQYIQGKLIAEAIDTKNPTKHWEYPTPIIEPEELANALNGIPSQIQFSGENVSMIILAPSIECLMLKVPAMDTSDLKEHLAWKAHAIKGASYIWSYTLFYGIDKALNLNLHLVPDAFRSIFTSFCQKYGYQPMHLLPLAAVAPLLLTKNDNTADSVEMVVAPAFQSTFLIVGNKNSPLVVREIPYVWTTGEEETLERMKREFQRTALFISQRFKKQVSLICIRGAGAEMARSLTSLIHDSEVVVDESEPAWARSVMESSPFRTDNLLETRVIGHNRRRRMIVFVLFVLLLFLSAEMAVNVLLTRISTTESTVTSAGFNREIKDLTNRKKAIEIRKGKIAAAGALTEIISQQKSDPVPGWFAAYTANIIPDGMVLTRLKIWKDSTTCQWNVEMEGTIPRNPLQAEILLDTLQQRLFSSPCNMSGKMLGNDLWLKNLMKGSTAESDTKGKTFKITGKLQ
jgi:hypothetical protein